MTILVTGGAGFIGCNLVRLLLTRGQEVVVLDSLWTGSLENIRPFKENLNFRYIIGDVRDALPQIDNVKEIFHLACPASPDDFEKNPIEILETCFVGTKNILDFAAKHGAKVLLASTSEIYGDPQVAVQSESYFGNVNSFGPRSCYDEGKRVAEALAYSYRSKHGLDIRIARIFNAYGPWMRINDGRAVPNFIAAAMEGQPIKIYGDGSATRSFQFVTDCVLGLTALMDSNYSSPVNIGSDHEVPVSDIAQTILKTVATKTGKPIVPVCLLEKRQDDPVRRKPDITTAERELGWTPNVPLEQGITSTVDWFLERRENAPQVMNPVA
ncbi:hypothetical protein B0I35DRAFT_449872 [Stachybotrys elegans]|uniref:UDP-glucuronic acid decarboxylase 1 n=1 Tax=Stachybotrys elegans TaxID=80388 RepID=A0A8K0WT34_9HYPO|nr:hypothetical protein B0I35DRAFT_449872 [Stachybotrys elegans]